MKVRKQMINETEIIPKVTVVDSVMGSGKTSAAINMINSSSNDVHYLYITPYLDEVDRIIKNCPNKKFKQPKNRKGTKLEDIKSLINKGENIVSTHALFRKFNKETIELTYINNYVLIMDEVADVVDIYNDPLEDDGEKRIITKEDIQTILEKYAYVDEENYLLRWTDKEYPNNGVFSNIKRMAELESLTIYNNQIFLWLFPVTVFQAFQHVYILTYLFDAQVQKYYYDLYNIKYDKLAANKNIGRYKFVEYNEDNQNVNKIDYNKLITIVDNEKINGIGKFDYTLSSSWYEKASKQTLNILKKNIYNFFNNITRTKADKNLWTTFKKAKTSLSGNGYTKGFAPLNSRATNQYRDRTAVAYTVNRFLNPNIKNYFSTHNVKVDEEEYALSEMLQFIWRSAIRDDKHIDIYIPSERMRILLQVWIYNMCKDLETSIETDK